MNISQKFYSVLIIVIVTSCQNSNPPPSQMQLNGVWVNSIDEGLLNSSKVSYQFCKSNTIADVLRSPWPFLISYDTEKFIQLFEENGIFRSIPLSKDQNLKVITSSEVITGEFQNGFEDKDGKIQIISTLQNKTIQENYEITEKGKLRITVTIEEDGQPQIKNTFEYNKRNDLTISQIKCN